MTALADRSPEICNENSSALSESDIQPLLKELEGWKVDSGGDFSQILKIYRFKDFVSAQAFANVIADLAEQQNHHPRICIEWGKVTVSWWTHTVSGLFINDFIMAARCDLNNT